MARGRKRVDKYCWLDPAKIKRAQKVFGARTETETIERALDLAISEHKRNRLAEQANERFVKGGVENRDVYRILPSGKMRLPKARIDVKKLLKIPTGRVAGNKAVQALLADREEGR
jgi:hypothetical protein